MKELLEMIAYFPGEFIALVIAVIGSIISISISKSKDEKSHNKDSINYLLIFFMVIICVLIIRIAYLYKGKEPPKSDPQIFQSTQDTMLTTDSELQESDFAYVEASSTYDGDLTTHIATNLIDGKRETNWTEGVDGHGVGEYVQFVFQQKQTITGFRICSGNHSSDSYYTKNSRPKEIKLTFEDGSSEDFTLRDVKEELVFELAEAVTTKSIRLTIQSVYEGSSWGDTVISEIVFLAAK